MKNILKFSFSILLIASCFCAFAANLRFGVLTGDDVAVREGISTDSAKLGELDKGQKLEVIKSNGDFYQIKYKNSVGHISDKYVAIQAAKSGVISASNVSMREGPSVDTQKLDTLHQGQSINVYHTEGDFYQVTTEDQLGYVSKEFVEISSTVKARQQTTTAKTSKEEKAPEAEKSKEPEVKKEKTYNVSPPRFNEDELLLAARLVHHESNRTKVSAEAVASVILNRIMSSNFPNSIYEVAFQKNQFTVHDDEAFAAEQPGSAANNAIQAVFVAGKVTLPSDVCYFRSAELPKSWGKRDYYATIGGNHYYS